MYVGLSGSETQQSLPALGFTSSTQPTKLEWMH